MQLSIKKLAASSLLTLSLVATTLIAATVPAYATNSSLTLQTERVANAATFTVNLNAASSVPVAGAQAFVSFNVTVLAFNGITYNTASPFFGGDEYNVGANVTNANVTGVVPVYSSTGANTTVTGSGLWATLSFTALSAADDSVNTIHLISTATVIGSNTYGPSSFADGTPSFVATDLVDGIIAVGNPPSLTLQSKSIGNSSTFDVTLIAGTSVDVQGGQAAITFDPNALTCNTVTYNKTTPYFNSSDGEYDHGATINNTTGQISGITSTTGGTHTVTGTGVWVTLNFTANSAASNSITTIHLGSGSYLASSPDGVHAVPLTTYLADGVITIGTPPLPHLTVSNIVATGVSANLSNYNISFRVNNIGNLDAGASTASIVVNSGSPIYISVPAIAASGNVVESTTSPISITGFSDTFVITADCYQGVFQTNRDNSVGSGSYSYVPATGAVTIASGSIAPTLTFTQPGTIAFGTLALGPNTVSSNMTVLSNQLWTVTATGLAPAGSFTDGKMTKYTDSTLSYDPAVKLHIPLNVSANNSVGLGTGNSIDLTGDAATLATGVAEGQNPDGTSGELRNVTFNQTMEGRDAALASGSIYQIRVEFTASTNYY